MVGNQKDLLNTMKFELAFLELGGYARSVRDPRRELSVFQDSPSCPNYAAPVKTHPCEECFLMSFIPAEKRGEPVPCHHIPLNSAGDTAASLEGSGDDFRVQEALRGWLHKKIEQIEATQAEPA